MPKHYVEISNSIWTELTALQKKYKILPKVITDDVFALAGDLEAICEAICEAYKDLESTRAAVLEPTTGELEDLI